MDEKIKIGDTLICIKAEGWFEDRLILGETYIVDDIESKFPGKVAVKYKGPHYFHVEFVPEEYFDKKSAIRDKILSEILDE